MPLATITDKWQITIPKFIRTKLMLRAGDKLEFILTSHREAVVRHLPKPLDDLLGRLQAIGRKAGAVDKAEEAIERDMTGKIS